MKVENPGKAAKTLKKMGASPGDCDDNSSFTLINHLEEGLSVKEQLARFSDYFIATAGPAVGRSKKKAVRNMTGRNTANPRLPNI